MANPTTNFGWVMPTSTDLVTDLPADFNVFGQAVDTSMQDLLGGTTGQVLSKTSATNMDFTWVTPTDQTPLTTKGDLFTFTTVDARLGVGTDGQTLVADSSTATGLKWATPASGASFVGCSIFKQTTNQSLATNTYTAITFNAEEFDTDGFHDNTTNNSRITIPTGKGGKYLIIATAAFAANATGTRSMSIYKNGSNTLDTFQHAPTPSIALRGEVTGILSLNAADYIELYAEQRSGGNLDVNAEQGGTRFAAIYLGA